MNSAQRTIVIQMTVVVLLSELFKGTNATVDVLYEWLYTVIAFLIAYSVKKALNSQIVDVDHKLGKPMFADVVGPTAMFLSKALLSRTSIDRVYLLKILYTVVGYACYNFLLHEKLESANTEENTKNIVASAIKALVMLLVRGYLTSPTYRPSRTDFYIANAFAMGTLVVQAFNI